MILNEECVHACVSRSRKSVPSFNACGISGERTGERKILNENDSLIFMTCNVWNVCDTSYVSISDEKRKGEGYVKKIQMYQTNSYLIHFKFIYMLKFNFLDFKSNP